MIVYCSKREAQDIHRAEAANKCLEMLCDDLEKKGLKFSRDEWKEVLSGEIKKFREFVYLKWAEKNDPLNKIEYLSNRDSVAYGLPSVLDNMSNYEFAFNGVSYNDFEFAFKRDGRPFIDIKKFRASFSGIYTVEVDDLTSEEIKNLKDECKQLTNDLQSGKVLEPKDLKPGFRKGFNCYTESMIVTFNLTNYYRDMAKLYMKINDSK